jgi:hypothetical protein
MWQIRYWGSTELPIRDAWEGSFLVVQDDGEEQKVKVRLTWELVVTIEENWPINAEPDFLIRRLGTKAILAQLHQKGEVDKLIWLKTKEYPGHPGRPDVHKNCRLLERHPGKMLCTIASPGDEQQGMTNLKACETCEYPFLVLECRHLAAETTWVEENVRAVTKAGCALGQGDFQLDTCSRRACFKPRPIPLGGSEYRSPLGLIRER